MLIKWFFDRAAALFGLLLLWPVLLIVAILVKVKMPGGPAFFVQKRVGKGGKLFKCHKFRTMTVNHNGSTVSVAGDKRPMQEIATEYNDTVIYPDKVRLNCYYYRHYSFVKDMEMIFATVLGFKVKFAGEEV